jgi:hypothetical protein
VRPRRDTAPRPRRHIARRGFVQTTGATASSYMRYMRSKGAVMLQSDKKTAVINGQRMAYREIGEGRGHQGRAVGNFVQRLRTSSHVFARLRTPTER